MAAQPTAAGFKVLLRGSLRDGQGPAARTTSLTLHGGHHRRMLSRMPPHRWHLIRPLSCQLDSPPAFTTKFDLLLCFYKIYAWWHTEEYNKKHMVRLVAAARYVCLKACYGRISWQLAYVYLYMRYMHDV
jgi:hypothetical protein